MAKLSNKQKAEIIKMVKSGTSVSEIAKEFGISTSGVYYVMKSKGVQASAPRTKKEVIQEEVDEIEETEETEAEIDEDTWQMRAQYWLTKYMEAHIELLELKEKYQV
jgi:transposase-like protein